MKPNLKSKFRIKGYRGIFKTTNFEDNIIYLVNSKDENIKTSLIYGVRHPTKGHLTGAINPNLRLLNET